MASRWSNLRSSWAPSSVNESEEGSQKHDDQPQKSSSTLPPDTFDVISNPAPPSTENDTIESSKEEQSVTTLQAWQLKKQALVSSWRKRSSTNGSNMSATKQTTVEGEPSEDQSASESIMDSNAMSHSFQYGELLSSPPLQISFVIISKKQCSTTDRYPLHQESNESEKVEPPANENSVEFSESIDNLPADVGNLGVLLGVELVKNPNTKQFEVSNSISIKPTDGEPLLPSDQASLLVPGDVLQAINGFSCRGFRDENQLYKRILQEQSSLKTMTTLTFLCQASSNGPDQEKHGVSAPAVHEVIFIAENNKVHGVSVDGDMQRLSSEEPNSASPKFDLDPERFVLKASTRPDPILSSQILRLDSIPLHNCLQQTCARTKDVILSINDIPCFELSPDDANSVFQTMLQIHSTVKIKFYSPPLSRRESIKRAAVATAGGVLVGTGAIIMVTPLHPIGHAMAIGGLGVLGTEFEGPKRALSRVTDAARRMRSSYSRSGEQSNQIHHCKEKEESSTST
ncbi:putative transmembrane protein PGPGW [Nitzschia inconspicua]|uniref:Transmembrane protein PGPGW n=1 Tax=Nitzschia inconspicua TaxID=303405 RepID=A0A9K3LER9_9STRA|nr:putative transmembrane protein PGPGW [Nitzschia inconspicua]